MFLAKNDLLDAYTETRDHHRQYFQYFDEYERLARARPSPKLDKHLPKAVDGTLAGIIKEQPKRIIQQTPSGVVYCDSEPELAEVAGYVLSDYLDPLSNTQGSVYQKSLVMLNKALTYGCSASYTYFTNTADRYHTDFVIPYIKDILIEKAKTYGPDSNILFMNAWYTKRDVQGIIDKETELKKKDPKYKTPWNLKKLADLKEIGEQAKDSQDETPFEQEKGNNPSGILLVYAFQKGVESDFYVFAPALNEGKDGVTGGESVVKTWTNPDPRGFLPIDFLYADIDLSCPYGRGAVEISAGTQNLLDHQMVMFQFMSTMMMGPPLQMWGNMTKSDKKFRPNAIWDMGNSANNKIEPYKVDNYALANFPNNYGLLKSQILNLNSSLDTSVSAESGNPGFSKTPAGVKQNEQRLSVTDNYMRKQYEKWRSDQAESSLNLFFAEMEGKGELEIPQEKALNMSAETLKKYYDFQADKLKIPYGDIKEQVFKFQVDAGSSKASEDQDNADKLTEALRIGQNLLTDAQKLAVFRLIITEIGVKGIDQIFPPEGSIQDAIQRMEQEAKQGQEQSLVGEQVPNAPEAAMPEEIQQAAAPVEGGYQEAQAMPQPPADPMAEQFALSLSEQGFPPELVSQVEDMLQQGVSSDEILAQLGAA